MGNHPESADQFLDEHEAARRLGLSPGTLKTWRHLDKGPSYLKIGKKVLYRASAVEAYLATCERSPHSGAAA